MENHCFPRVSFASLQQKNVLSSSIYCANCPHLFGDFYPWTSSIFPSAVLVLWFQHAQGEKKSSGSCFPDQVHRCKSPRLGHVGVSQHLGGEDLLPDANQNPFSIRFLLDVQCLGIWRFPVYFFHLFTTSLVVTGSIVTFASVENWPQSEVKTLKAPTAICGVMGFPICKQRPP